MTMSKLRVSWVMPLLSTFPVWSWFFSFPASWPRGVYPPPPPVYRFPVLNFCSTCLINASLQSNPWQMPIGNAQNEVIGCNPQLGGVPGLPKLLWKQAWKRTKPTNVYIGHENTFEMTKQEQLPSIIPTPSTLLCFLAKAWRAASSRKGTAALDSLNLQESKICVLHSCWVSSFKKKSSEIILNMGLCLAL